jgi:DNA-binding MarR family transcriptional regulator
MPRKSAPADALSLHDAHAEAAEWRQYTFGRLLLFASGTYESRMLEAYAAAGFGDVRQVHLYVTRHIDLAGGTRIVDLATRAGITKSAMGRLVVECEALGLVELSADPADGRAKVVTLAKRGHTLMGVTQRSSKRIEADFAKLIGAEAFAALRGGLIELRAKTTARSRKRGAAN